MIIELYVYATVKLVGHINIELSHQNSWQKRNKSQRVISSFYSPLAISSAEMFFLPIPLLVVANVIAFVSGSHSDIRYVRPAYSPPSSCPGQPCLTLHEYVEIDNFTSGTTLQFLPGNHTLQQSFTIEHISNITFEAASDNSVTNIISKDNITVYFNGVTHMDIVGLSFILRQREDRSCALQFSSCKSVFISGTLFEGSGEVTGRAIRVIDSEATVSRCVFKSLAIDERRSCGAISSSGTNLTIHESSFINNVASDAGGAIYSIGTNLAIHGSSFINNDAGKLGGAVHLSSCHLLLNETIFENNSAKRKGGAIDCDSDCQVEMVGSNTFLNNSCKEEACDGGAMYFLYSQLNIAHGIAYFKHNKAGVGGAISLVETNALFSGRVIMWKNAAVYDGGAINLNKYVLNRLVVFINDNYLSLIENTAGYEGGALYVSRGNVTLHGNVTIASNTATLGGGIRADRSHILVAGDCDLDENNSTYGGAVNALYGTVSLQGPTQFTHNTAGEDGGAIFAAGTVIHILQHVEFSFNSAKNGGAMFLENGASLNLSAPRYFKGYLLTSSFNYAHRDGGVIYNRDSPSIYQCSYSDIDTQLPNCFLKLKSDYHSLFYPSIFSKNDSAENEGNFMFGGLMDRCKILGSIRTVYVYNTAISIYPNSKPTEKEIASQPYAMCFCISGCNSSVIQMEVHRGQKFTVSLLAKMQYGITTAIVTAVTSSTARLETYQTSQPLPDYCAPLSYTVYSNQSYEQVVLYPDGPCRDIGLAKVVLDVTLLPCPDGFTQSGEICTCEDRLHDYPVNCTIADTPYLTKTVGLNFWIGASYVNTTYRGLVLCKSCPAEYCKKGGVNVIIDNPDMQCDLNRTGLLCGACAANHSLMLGSSQCQVCPNTYLALLLPFAAAGVALVVFLTSLRLTLATGTLNSVMLYANILQAKRSLFFPQNTRNLLTVFLAWMNLDLGFQTCFYDGLDAYALTWFQFAFPVYVWCIIGLIIFISRYSITVSKLIGSNPVAVLATLLLMSYTKILKIIIEVYSYNQLDYPDNKTVSVWLKDANVPYLESRHLFLTVMTSLVLVFLFLPYTLLLLFGHKLYRFMGKKHWRWLNRLKPLLDSYYAPYKNHTRYWTGFLLLVRCALYITFSLSSASKSLLTITLSFTVIGFTICYLRIYKSTLVNLIEACVYLNLILLSVTTLTGLNTAALVYSLVGLVFVVMIALIAHQFHLLYIAKTALWLRLKNKWPRFRKVSPEVQTNDDTINPSHDPHKLVTKTVIELREPLLDI